MRSRSFSAVLAVLALLPGNLAWGQANLPNNPNAATVQGPDPTGMLGYPLATVPATGALPWPITGAVTQGTSPWIVRQDNPPSADRIIGPTTVSAVGVTDVVIDCAGCSTVGIEFVNTAGSFNGTISFRAQNANGNQQPMAVQDSNVTIGQWKFNVLLPAVELVQNGLTVFWANTAGLTKFVVRVTLVSGTLDVTLHGTAATHPIAPSVPNAVAGFTPGAFPGSASWGKAAGSNTYSPQTVQTSLPLTSGPSGTEGYLLTDSVPLLWNGAALLVQRTPGVFNTAATAAAGNTALWTPAAGKKFRLMRYMVTVTDQATQAAPATLTVSLFDGAAGATGQVHDTFVPALALVNTGALYSSGWIDLGNGYLSTAANNVLNINLSAALTAGTVRVICCGTEE